MEKSFRDTTVRLNCGTGHGFGFEANIDTLVSPSPQDIAILCPMKRM